MFKMPRDFILGYFYLVYVMEKGLRYNKEKLKWSLVDFESLEEMVKVLEFGAEKYEPDNLIVLVNGEDAHLDSLYLE